MLPESRVRKKWSEVPHAKELDLRFSDLQKNLQTDTFEPHAGASIIYLLWKLNGYLKWHNVRDQNSQSRSSAIFSERQRHIFRLKSCEESENQGHMSHNTRHYSAFSDTCLLASRNHSNRKCGARAGDNKARGTRLLTTIEQVHRKPHAPRPAHMLDSSQMSQLYAQETCPSSTCAQH